MYLRRVRVICIQAVNIESTLQSKTVNTLTAYLTKVILTGAYEPFRKTHSRVTQ